MTNRTKKLIWESSYLNIYELEKGVMYMDWGGYISVDLVKKGCDHILEVVKAHDCDHFINDNRRVKGSWTQAISWLENDYMPRLIKQGLAKIAFLFYPQQLAGYSIQRLLEVNDQYQGQTFNDFNEAFAWLTGEGYTDFDKPYVMIKTLDEYAKIYLNEIYYLSAHHGQVLIQTVDTQYTSRKTLSQLLDMLPEPQYMRIHKSHIVNTDKIASLKYYAGGNYHLYLKDFDKVCFVASKTYVQELKALLQY